MKAWLIAGKTKAWKYMLGVLSLATCTWYSGRKKIDIKGAENFYL